MRSLRTLFCLSAACTAVIATAQPQAGTEEEAPPRYNVEIIIFAHNDVDPGEERFDLVGAAVTAPTDALGDVQPPAEAILAIETLTAADPAESTAAVAPDGPAGQTPAAVAAADTDNAADLPGAEDPFDFVNPFGDAVPPGLGFDGPAEESIRLLTADELSLGDARRIIDRLGAYRLLGHGGWQQDGLDEQDAISFDVSNLGITNPRGTVRLYLGRFLHFGIDLEYRLPPGLRLPTAPEPAGDPAAITDSVPPLSPIQGSAPRRLSPLQEIEIADRLHFATERNAIRSGELHYIDHPLFGVLVLITPAPDPEEEDADSAALDQPAA